jgi:hypothetical protein
VEWSNILTCRQYQKSSIHWPKKPKLLQNRQPIPQNEHTLKGILDKKPSQIHQENKENLNFLKKYKKDSPWVVVGVEVLRGLNRSWKKKKKKKKKNGDFGMSGMVKHFDM